MYWIGKSELCSETKSSGGLDRDQDKHKACDLALKDESAWDGTLKHPQ